MTEGYIVQPQKDGSLNVRYENADGIVHRSVVIPGGFIDGTWTATDLSGQPQEVKDMAAKTWTPDVIAAWQATHPASD